MARLSVAALELVAVAELVSRRGKAASLVACSTVGAGALSARAALARMLLSDRAVVDSGGDAETGFCWVTEELTC